MVNLRAAIVRALDALEDGDSIYATEILRVAVDELDGPNNPPKLTCPDCGLHFDFPGQLVDHRDNVHGQAAA